ncbi:hypothetical protein O6H91_08G064500 [Diphasiastrum complanatum]|uniref:Uncharacterized protein n=1 Tax=Diphasiastrum complanatum TaxID=34168 RepID=A0ACC2CYG9_DIPCM|nr:hypothetical protein O6H91_08G064500 [Diphasiastrum complanatum]
MSRIGSDDWLQSCPDMQAAHMPDSEFHRLIDEMKHKHIQTPERSTIAETNPSLEHSTISLLQQKFQQLERDKKMRSAKHLNVQQSHCSNTLHPVPSTVSSPRPQYTVPVSQRFASNTSHGKMSERRSDPRELTPTAVIPGYLNRSNSLEASPGSNTRSSGSSGSWWAERSSTEEITSGRSKLAAAYMQMGNCPVETFSPGASMFQRSAAPRLPDSERLYGQDTTVRKTKSQEIIDLTDDTSSYSCLDMNPAPGSESLSDIDMRLSYLAPEYFQASYQGNRSPQFWKEQRPNSSNALPVPFTSINSGKKLTYSEILQNPQQGADEEIDTSLHL